MGTDLWSLKFWLFPFPNSALKIRKIQIPKIRKLGQVIFVGRAPWEDYEIKMQEVY